MPEKREGCRKASELTDLVLALKEGGILLRSSTKEFPTFKLAQNPDWKKGGEVDCKYIIAPVDNNMVISWSPRNNSPYLIEHFTQYDWVTIFNLRYQPTDERFSVHVLKNPEDLYLHLDYQEFYLDD